ncbi:hypothetical protein [Streptococcus sinensis]|uniref:Uncharacterized protein n=1 Tax=Streptococcus sinensis TaxID=176090 RepID=A0A0A0DFP6_9STRE|nr:hypothetical protein [Streptococcus sinensis]KGM36865.1 hypothetical protein SSIN_1380 [Streptococcus sinensis]
MNKKIELKNIFTPGSQPDVTYNDRLGIGLEEQLEQLVYFDGQLGVVAGKSKLGKTVLVNRKFPSNEVIFIQEQDLKDKSIEEVIHEKLGIERPVKTRTSYTNSSFDSEVEVGTSLESIPFLKFLQAKGSLKGGVSKQNGTEVKYTASSDLFQLAIEYLITNKIKLIFDDFHYINPQQQKDIIHRLKEPISRGLHVILILIPMRQNQPIEVETDMKGRVQYVEVPAWSNEELGYIASKGFKELNAEISEELLISFVENSFKNPFLMQKICAQYCLTKGIKERSKEKISFEYDKNEVEKIYKSINTGEDETVRKLREGKPTKGKRRNLYSLKDGTDADIYTILIKVLSKLCHHDKIAYTDFVEEVRKSLAEDKSIQNNQITNTLKNISEIAENIYPKEPVVIFKDNQIMIDNDMFRFSLRWGQIK